MKRSVKFILVAAIAFSGSLWLGGTPPALAATQTKEQAASCYSRYDYSENKKTYRDGATEIVSYPKNKPCFNNTTGNCLFMPVSKGSAQSRIECTKNPGSNKAHHDKVTKESEEAQDKRDNYEGYTDQAATAATCTKDDCDIISNFVNPAIQLLSVLVGIAIVIGIIFGGIQVASSAGDPQKAASGKNHIRNALIGLVSYILLFIFLNWVVPGGVI